MYLVDQRHHALNCSADPTVADISTEKGIPHQSPKQLHRGSNGHVVQSLALQAYSTCDMNRPSYGYRLSKQLHEWEMDRAYFDGLSFRPPLDA